MAGPISPLREPSPFIGQQSTHSNVTNMGWTSIYINGHLLLFKLFRDQTCPLFEVTDKRNGYNGFERLFICISTDC